MVYSRQGAFRSGTLNQFISIAVLIVLILMMGWFIFRSSQIQINRVLRGERSLDDKDFWLVHTQPTPARVMAKKETFKPQAKGIAKVDLELEIQLPEKAPLQVTTCWLVEIPSLPELAVGKTVEVKFDPKNPNRIFPAVSWARLWQFSK